MNKKLRSKLRKQEMALKMKGNETTRTATLNKISIQLAEHSEKIFSKVSQEDHVGYQRLMSTLKEYIAKGGRQHLVFEFDDQYDVDLELYDHLNKQDVVRLAKKQGGPAAAEPEPASPPPAAQPMPAMDK